MKTSKPKQKTKTSNKTKYLFISANVDWADEFSCEAFQVTTEEAHNKYLERVELGLTYNEDAEFYFGTNEALQFTDFHDFKRQLTVKEITKEQADVILKTFGMKLHDHWGTGSGSIFDCEFELDEEELDDDL